MTMHTTLQAALDACNLPHESKSKLAKLVRDPPPSGRYKTLNEVLYHNEISPAFGASGVRQEIRAADIALYGLVYFAGEFIAFSRFVGWFLYQTRMKDENTQVRLFQKNLSKVRRVIENYNIPCVGLLTQKATSTPDSVDGFRATISGDDYTKILQKDTTRVRGSTRTWASHLNDARCPLSTIKDKGLREWVEKSRDVRDAMADEHIFAHFDAPAPLALPPKKP